jgi:hypothetical protein
MLPAISKIRMQSRLLQSGTSLKTWAQCVTNYQADNKEYFPRFTEWKWYTTPNDIQFRSNFWDARYAWVALMGPYVTRGEYERLIYCQGSRFTRAYTSYWYSSVFATGPKYWALDQYDLAAVKQGSRSADVVFPDRKVLLWDADAGYYGSSLRIQMPDLASSVPMAFVDGSVSQRIPADAKPPTKSREADGGSTIVARLSYTLEGARGVDY